MNQSPTDINQIIDDHNNTGDEIPMFFNSNFNSGFINLYRNDVKKLDIYTPSWTYVSKSHPTNSFVKLFSLNGQHDGCRYHTINELSSKNRLKIDIIKYDIIESIEVSCNSPDDISSIKIYEQVPHPKNPVIKRKLENNEELDEKESEWIYDSKEIYSTYECIYNVNNPNSSVVNCYIPRHVLMFTSLSLVVEYKNSYKLKNCSCGPNYAKINAIILNNRILKSLYDKYRNIAYQK